MEFWEATASSLLVIVICALAKIAFSKSSHVWIAFITNPTNYKKVSLLFLVTALLVYAFGNALIISDLFLPIVDVVVGCITGFITGTFIAIADDFYRMQ